jgi:hypothetical protein
VPGHGAGLGGQTGEATDDDAAGLLAIEMRNQIVDRLRLMNVRHSHHAWHRAGSDPIAPHGLAFFYLDHNSQPGGHGWRIRTATRLFLDGPEVANLPRLLAAQARIAEAYRHGRGLDARTHLATRVEPMTMRARYHGVGVSTLDLPGRPWAQQRYCSTEYDIFGHCYALLADGTWLLAHRGLPEQPTGLRIWSSHTLETAPGSSMRRWYWGRHLSDLADPATRHIWQPLHALHQVLTAAHHPGGGHAP